MNVREAFNLAGHKIPENAQMYFDYIPNHWSGLKYYRHVFRWWWIEKRKARKMSWTIEEFTEKEILLTDKGKFVPVDIRDVKHTHINIAEMDAQNCLKALPSEVKQVH